MSSVDDRRSLPRRSFLKLTALGLAGGAGVLVPRGLAQANSPALKVPPTERGVLIPQGSISAVPARIKVLIQGTGEIRDLLMEEYLRGVVPREVPSSWPREALRAQAVAARSYAAVGVANPRHGSAAVCNTTCCQVWSESYETTTDEAIWSTRGVAATYAGNIISALFYSRCDGVSTKNSEDAIYWQDNCARAGWNYVPYLRARPCTGHARSGMSSCGFYGHGVGMCQWGAYDMADPSNAKVGGHDYVSILKAYYTGIALSITDYVTGQSGAAPVPLNPREGQLVQSGQPWTYATFSWISIAQESQCEIWTDGWGKSSGWVAATESLQLLDPGPGTYYWHVKGRTDGVETPWSATRRLVVSDRIESIFLPQVGR